jgi:fumarate hydratase class II
MNVNEVISNRAIESWLDETLAAKSLFIQTTT